VRQLLSMGVAGYIAKPLVPDVVVAKLEPILKSIGPTRPGAPRTVNDRHLMR